MWYGTVGTVGTLSKVRLVRLPTVPTVLVHPKRPPLDPPLNLVRYGGTVMYGSLVRSVRSVRLVSVPNVPY